MNLPTIALCVLAGIGILSIVYIGWLLSKLETHEKEPEYTEKEKFYAELLLMKHDLDADAFATKKQILDELNNQPQEDFFDKMKEAFGVKDNS